MYPCLNMYEHYFKISPPYFFVKLNKSNVDAKIKGMESYEFEKRNFPHPRSPEALKIQAQRWGVTIGTEFAEAFMLVRNILK